MTEDQRQGHDMVTCPRCGTHFPASGARFCPACGQVLTAAQALSSAPAFAPAQQPGAPTPAAPAPPPAPAAHYPPPAYPPPPAHPQTQAYGSVPTYAQASGYAPPHARRNSTPIIVGLGAIALIVVVVAGAALVYSTEGSNATPSPSAVALATPTAAPASPTAVPTLPTVTMGGSSGSATEDAGIAALINYCAQQTGATVQFDFRQNTQFQNDAIDSYLYGTPDDIFEWHFGYPARRAAGKGLMTPISDSWQKAGDTYSDAYKVLSTGDDGNQYLLPLYSYPWVVMYRKSLFQKKGYQVPTTLAQFVALAQKMKADGVVPLASADKDGWPAEGTFDILDLRTNGYDFHMRLMAGKEKWTDPRVKAVFQQWTQLLPYFQPNAVSRIWQDGFQSLLDEKAGMFYFGTFALSSGFDQTAVGDIGMFPFPVFGNQYDGENAIDAPTDGLMLSAKNHDLSGAKKILECAAAADAQATRLKPAPAYVAAAKNADTSGYTPQQKDMYQIVGASQRIANYLDWDSRPDFGIAGSTAGVAAHLTDFLKNPSQNLDTFLAGIQTLWDSLPPD